MSDDFEFEDQSLAQDTVEYELEPCDPQVEVELVAMFNVYA